MKYFWRFLSTLAVVFFVIGLVLPSFVLAQPAEVWVDASNCPGPGSGTMTDPYCKIQDGITNVASPGIVHVAAGTYNENNINLRSGVQVLGAGADVTTIDGGAGDSVMIGNNVDSAAKVDGFTITNGSVASGGGIELRYNSSPTISNCTFYKNSAGSHGGGIYNYDSSSPTVTNCTFDQNEADYGGGICNYYNSSPMVTNCTFDQNEASYCGGGISNEYFCSLTVTNCIFDQNETDYGGSGIYNHNNSIGYLPTVTNCTFYLNKANYDGAGGIHNDFSPSPTVTNCILWQNGVDLYDCTATFSDIEDGDAGTGNISLNPLFVNPAASNFHLQKGSPCIDAGSNSAPAIPTTDFEGDPRIVDGNGDGNAVADMGVDEYVPPPPPPPPPGVVVGGTVAAESRPEVLGPIIGLATACAFIVWRSIARFRRRRATL